MAAVQKAIKVTPLSDMDYINLSARLGIGKEFYVFSQIRECKENPFVYQYGINLNNGRISVIK